MMTPGLGSRSGAVLIVLAMLCAGCNDNLPGKPNPEDRPQTPAEVTDFEVLFARNCSGCHGSSGTLGPAPPLNDPLFLAIVPDEVLLDVVRHGRAGTPMPAFSRELGGTLTDQQVQILAAGLKTTWSKHDAKFAVAPRYLSTASADDADRAAIDRGEKLFASVCALCHGDHGQGHGDDDSPGALNDPSVLALMSNPMLRRIIITGRPDLGMPDYAQTDGRDADFRPLTSDQIDDLVALLAHWRNTSAQVAASQVRPQPESTRVSSP